MKYLTGGEEVSDRKTHHQIELSRESILVLPSGKEADRKDPKMESFI